MPSLQGGRGGRRGEEEAARPTPPNFSLCLKLWSCENPPLPDHAFKAGSNNTTTTPYLPPPTRWGVSCLSKGHGA